MKVKIELSYQTKKECDEIIEKLRKEYPVKSWSVHSE